MFVRIQHMQNVFKKYADTGIRTNVFQFQTGLVSCLNVLLLGSIKNFIPLRFIISSFNYSTTYMTFDAAPQVH